ncbi:uncharacterized protein V6R79_003290 [Siganus canaliculatus]
MQRYRVEEISKTSGPWPPLHPRPSLHWHLRFIHQHVKKCNDSRQKSAASSEARRGGKRNLPLSVKVHPSVAPGDEQSEKRMTDKRRCVPPPPPPPPPASTFAGFSDVQCFGSEVEKSLISKPLDVGSSAAVTLIRTGFAINTAAATGCCAALKRCGERRTTTEKELQRNR